MKVLPKEFTERMIQQLGQNVFSDFENSLNLPTPISIRINPNKFERKLNLEKVEWCSNGYYLPERPLFVADPLWHGGAYYVQEAGSMALEQALLKIKAENNGQLSLLDLCAAPGGKSTHIASLLSKGDVLVSNEVIRTRVAVLNENLTKWGYPDTIITNSDSKDFAKCGELFDVIIVDAPCSGEGLFRKDEKAIEEWSIANMEICTLRQKRILEDVTQCLKPGGFLIYSTCTYNPAENELQINALQQKGFLPVHFTFNGNENYMHQCYPHHVKGEGFFIALLQKEEGETEESVKKKNFFLKEVKDASQYKDFVTRETSFYEFKNNIVALSERSRELFEDLHPTVNCYSIGTKVCEKNDKLLIPSEYLPFSTIFNANAFETKLLEYQEVLAYLGKQALPLSSQNKGYVVLQYENLIMGLGKFAGNRINNLFPNEWRLRRRVKAEEFFTIVSLIYPE